jgi:hypothetical protein
MTMMLPEIAPPEYVRRDWDRYQHWAALCTAGRCAYANLAGTAMDPPWQPASAGEVCPGYAGRLHLEAQRYLVRTRNCARKDAWWRRRQVVLRDLRQKRRAGDAATAKGWRED